MNPPFAQPTWSPARSSDVTNGWFRSIPSFVGISSLFAGALVSNSYMLDSFKILILGSLLEAGRRLLMWVIARVRIQYSMNIQFDEGDPAYEWLILFLTQEKVWQKSRAFRATAKTSERKWDVQGYTGTDSKSKPHLDLVPTFELPQLFRWRKYWLEIQRNNGGGIGGLNINIPGVPGIRSNSSILITIYTLDMAILHDFLEETRKRYVQVSKPNVIVHTMDSAMFGGPSIWTTVKRKNRRPLDSIVLPDGTMDALLSNCREFLELEKWYTEVGIPYRRGWLLHGPPGTGKSSTIYALAGELGLEIYSLSLSSGFIDDAFLQRAAMTVPKKSIFLVEDIDCAFRDDDDDRDEQTIHPQYPTFRASRPGRHRSAVTLSGLLNVLDGVGSEEGKLFFATTNHIDKLDEALIRPGRIDKRVEYNLATQGQASALFKRFFPESRFAAIGMDSLSSLADTFASSIPEHEFSTADLQGYLLSHRTNPVDAADGAGEWVLSERVQRCEKRKREEQRKTRSTKMRNASVDQGEAT